MVVDEPKSRGSIDTGIIEVKPTKPVPSYVKEFTNFCQDNPVESDQSKEFKRLLVNIKSALYRIKDKDIQRRKLLLEQRKNLWEIRRSKTSTSALLPEDWKPVWNRKGCYDSSSKAMDAISFSTDEPDSEKRHEFTREGRTWKCFAQGCDVTRRLVEVDGKFHIEERDAHNHSTRAKSNRFRFTAAQREALMKSSLVDIHGFNKKQALDFEYNYSRKLNKMTAAQWYRTRLSNCKPGVGEPCGRWASDDEKKWTIMLSSPELAKDWLDAPKVSRLCAIRVIFALQYCMIHSTPIVVIRPHKSYILLYRGQLPLCLDWTVIIATLIRTTRS